MGAHEIAKQGGWTFWWIRNIISDISMQKNSARKCVVVKANVNVSTFSHTLKDVFGITYIMQVNNITHITTQTSARKDNHLTWTIYAENLTKYKEFLRCNFNKWVKNEATFSNRTNIIFYFTVNLLSGSIQFTKIKINIWNMIPACLLSSCFWQVLQMTCKYWELDM